MLLQRWISLRGGPHLVFVLKAQGPVPAGLMAAGTLTTDVRIGHLVELAPGTNATVARISIFDNDAWTGTSAVAVSATHGRPVIIEVG